MKKKHRLVSDETIIKKIVSMHSSTYEYLCKNVDNIYTTERIAIGDYLTFIGKTIKIDNNLSPTVTLGQWIFPTNEPFITYEKSDESWCRYCGFGREAEKKDVQIGEVIGAEIDFVKIRGKVKGRSVVYCGNGTFKYG